MQPVGGAGESVAGEPGNFASIPSLGDSPKEILTGTFAQPHNALAGKVTVERALDRDHGNRRRRAWTATQTATLCGADSACPSLRTIPRIGRPGDCARVRGPRRAAHRATERGLGRAAGRRTRHSDFPDRSRSNPRCGLKTGFSGKILTGECECGRSGAAGGGPLYRGTCANLKFEYSARRNRVGARLRPSRGRPRPKSLGLRGWNRLCRANSPSWRIAKYGPKVRDTKASAILGCRRLLCKLPIATLISANPYLDFGRALALFYQPPQAEARNPCHGRDRRQRTDRARAHPSDRICAIGERVTHRPQCDAPPPCGDLRRCAGGRRLPRALACRGPRGMPRGGSRDPAKRTW